MGAAEFGQRVKEARQRQGISKSELGRRLTQRRPGGRVFDAAGITRIEKAGPVKVDQVLVQATISALTLDDPAVVERAKVDPADLWEAAGLWPPDLSVDDYRDFVTAGGARATEQHVPFTSRTAAFPARRLALVRQPDLRPRPVGRIPA